MSLLFKHLWRTLRRAPLQPVLILLTVVLSVAVAVSALSMQNWFAEKTEDAAARNMKPGDVLVTLRADSDTRWIFPEPVCREIGDRGEVFADFSLTAFSTEGSDRIVFRASAADLRQADAFYQFHYTEYGTFNTANLNASVILSSETAKLHGLHVGDVLRLSVLGTEQDYTVQAIAEPDGILATQDLLVPVGAITKVLTARVPAIAILGDSFIPCNRLMIRLSHPVDANTVCSDITGNPALSSLHAEPTAMGGQVSFLLFVKQLSFTLLAVLLVLLSGLLVGTSLERLERQRAAESALFCSVGASGRYLNVLRLAESMLYALAGTAGGILLALPVTSAVAALFPPEEMLSGNSPAIGIRECGAVFVLACVGMSACTVAHLLRHRRLPLAVRLEHAGNEGNLVNHMPSRKWLLPVILTTLVVLPLVFLPVSVRYWFGFPAAFLLIWAVYSSAPFVLRLLSGGGIYLTDRFFTNAGTLFLSLRGIRYKQALHHVCSLISVLIALLITVTTVGTVLSVHLQRVGAFLNAEYLAGGVTDAVGEQLTDDPAVQGTARFGLYEDVRLPDGYSASLLLFGEDEQECFRADFLPRTLPQGREVVLSAGLASALEVRVGDSVAVTVQGVSYQLTVCGIADEVANLIMANSDGLGLSPQFLAIRLKEGVDANAATERLTGMLETQGAVLIPAETWQKAYQGSLPGFLELIRWAILAAMFISMTGIANLLAEQFRCERAERNMLRSVGASKVRIASVCAGELLLTVTVSALLGIAAGFLLCVLADVCTRSFGVALLFF